MSFKALDQFDTEPGTDTGERNRRASQKLFIPVLVFGILLIIWTLAKLATAMITFNVGFGEVSGLLILQSAVAIVMSLLVLQYAQNLRRFSKSAKTEDLWMAFSRFKVLLMIYFGVCILNLVMSAML